MDKKKICVLVYGNTVAGDEVYTELHRSLDEVWESFKETLRDERFSQDGDGGEWYDENETPFPTNLLEACHYWRSTGEFIHVAEVDVPAEFLRDE